MSFGFFEIKKKLNNPFAPTRRTLATLPFINLKLCTHIIYLLLHHSYIVYVLFVSDTNLDCNMVRVSYVRYHNTVTSGNPGENCPVLTNCP